MSGSYGAWEVIAHCENAHCWKAIAESQWIFPDPVITNLAPPTCPDCRQKAVSISKKSPSNTTLLIRLNPTDRPWWKETCSPLKPSPRTVYEVKLEEIPTENSLEEPVLPKLTYEPFHRESKFEIIFKELSIKYSDSNLLRYLLTGFVYNTYTQQAKAYCDRFIRRDYSVGVDVNFMKKIEDCLLEVNWYPALRESIRKEVAIGRSLKDSWGIGLSDLCERYVRNRMENEK